MMPFHSLKRLRRRESRLKRNRDKNKNSLVVQKSVAMPSSLPDELRKLHAKLREETKSKWDRVLPFDELLFDRWEKASFLGVGDGTSLYHSSYVYGNVQIGNNTWVGPFTLLDGSGGLRIGKGCSISAGVQIYTHNTVTRTLAGRDLRVGVERAPTRIGDCCYIGPQTVIDMGVTIGEHCVIGAYSLVNKDIPSHSVAFGIPCRVRGHTKIGPDGTWETEEDSTT
jgi:acetyltransferase-like isoleucine patch superfamily enzyme